MKKRSKQMLLILIIIMSMITAIRASAESTGKYTDAQTMLFYNYSSYSHNTTLTSAFAEVLKTANDGDVITLKSADETVTATWIAGSPLPNPFPDEGGYEPDGAAGFSHNGNLSLNSLFMSQTINCTVDLSDFDMNICTNLYRMFYQANLKSPNDIIWWNKNIDGKSFNMQEMFRYCTSVKKLDFSTWGDFKISNLVRAFEGAKNITSIDFSTVTSVNSNNTSYAFSDTGINIFDIPLPLTAASLTVADQLRSAVNPDYIKIIVSGAPEDEDDEVYGGDKGIVYPRNSYNYAFNNNIGKTLTKNGVTLINNEDGSVTCSGECTGDFTYCINSRSENPWTMVYGIDIPSPDKYYLSGAVGNIHVTVNSKHISGATAFKNDSGILSVSGTTKVGYGIKFTNGTVYDGTVYPGLYKGTKSKDYVKAGKINYFPMMKNSVESVMDIFYKMNLDPANALKRAKTPMFAYIDDNFGTGSANAYNIANDLNIKITFAAKYENIGTDNTAGLERAKKYYNEGHQIIMKGLPPGYTWTNQRNIELGLNQYIAYMRSNDFIDSEYEISPDDTAADYAQAACRNKVKGLCNGGGEKAYNYNAENGKYDINRLFITKDSDTAQIKEAIDTVAEHGGLVVLSTTSDDAASFDADKTKECLQYAIDKGLLNMTLGEAIKRRTPIYDLYNIFK